VSRQSPGAGSVAPSAATARTAQPRPRRLPYQDPARALGRPPQRAAPL